MLSDGSNKSLPTSVPKKQLKYQIQAKLPTELPAIEGKVACDLDGKL
jgi:hypothetical protein